MRTMPRVAPLLAMILLSLMLAPPAQAHHRLPYHWNRNHPTQTAVAQAYFVDHTGPNWPVYSMILGPWNNRPAYYRPYYLNPGDCNNNVVHCVPVRNINDPNRARGVTTYTVNLETNHVVHGSMEVLYNNAYNYTEALRREVTCHELGHATGTLDEGAHDGSCMAAGSPYVDNASDHDYDIIEDVYNH